MNTFTQEEQVVLVDEQCRELGLMGKMEAHEKGVLHKAISVLIYNTTGEMLVTQRALGKYHWPGIWSNTCCSHPRQAESFSAAAHRRLREETGIETPLEELFSFVYRAQDEQTGLIEHEYDVVFRGVYDGGCAMNPEEIGDYKWYTIDELKKEIQQQPEKFSFWFKVILEEMEKRELF